MSPSAIRLFSSGSIQRNIFVIICRIMSFLLKMHKRKILLWQFTRLFYKFFNIFISYSSLIYIQQVSWVSQSQYHTVKINSYRYRIFQKVFSVEAATHSQNFAKHVFYIIVPNFNLQTIKRIKQVCTETPIPYTKNILFTDTFSV